MKNTELNALAVYDGRCIKPEIQYNIRCYMLRLHYHKLKRNIEEHDEKTFNNS